MLVHNPTVMRRLSLLVICVSLLQAFFMAPYQHVHLGAAHQRHEDHHESPPLYSHFYSAFSSGVRNSAPKLGHVHKGHGAFSLDTFTALQHSALFLVFRPEAVALVFSPAQSDVCIETIEPRGHDPPCFENRVPRAPPL